MWEGKKPLESEKKMKKIITIEWEIHDTRKMNEGCRVGVSTLAIKTRDTAKAINAVIDFAGNLPSWEFERNDIDLEEYREGKTCRYHYTTKLTKILKIETAK